MNNKNYFHFMLGVIVCSIIDHYSKTPPTWTSIIIISVLTIIFTFDKLNKVVMFFFLTSMVIYQPIGWMMGKFIWWEVLIEIWFIVVLCYNYFPKRYKPLFVDYGDITRFPVEQVPMELFPINITPNK